MKRSKKAALILMVPATTLLLSGCGEEREQAMVFTDPNQCSSAGFNTAEACEADYEAAKNLHPQVAPKYLTQQECEADFGNGQCETAPQQTTSGGSVFMPMMMGYLAGQMFNRPQAGAYQTQSSQSASGNASGFSGGNAAARSNVATQPLYKSRDDRQTFRTATNAPVSQGIGPITLRPSQVKPQAGQLVRRGGFGQQAAARNSFGG